MSTPKTCFLCKHCSIDFGMRGYSEETPGSPGKWECLKDHWSYGQDDSPTKDELQKALHLAETCPDFVAEDQ